MTQKKQTFLITLVTSIFLAFLFFACTETEATWLKDFEEAQEIAREENKNILLFFTGSDWDEVSQELISEVFPSKAFLSKIASQYILLQVDFPDDESLTSEEEFYKNYTLASRFALSGIPAAILVTKDGYIIDSYSEHSQAKTANDYVKQIQKAKNKAKKIISLTKQMEKAEGVQKAKLIGKLLDLFNPDYKHLYADLTYQIPELDPNNKTKLNDKYVVAITYTKAMNAYSVGEVEEAIELLVNLGTNKKISKKDVQEAYYTAAFLNAENGYSLEKSIEYLNLSLAADPESNIAQNIQQVIQMMQLELDGDQDLALSADDLYETELYEGDGE